MLSAALGEGAGYVSIQTIQALIGVCVFVSCMHVQMQQRTRWGNFLSGTPDWSNWSPFLLLVLAGYLAADYQGNMPWLSQPDASMHCRRKYTPNVQ